MLPRQKGVAVETHPPVRCFGLAALQHHITRHVGVFASQPVGGPRPGAGKSQERESGVDHVIALSVLVDRGGHRSHDGQFVHHASDVGKHRADRDATLPPLLEGEGAGHDVAIVVELRPLHLHRHRLAVIERQPGLRIERVDLRDAPRHEAEDHAFGFGRMVRVAQCRSSRQGGASA